MHKKANTQHEIHALLQSRWSPRAYSNRPVEAEKLLSLFEAARWSPSGGNTQPWGFVVVTQTNVETHRKLVETLTGRNPLWAAQAPVLVLVVAKPPRPDRPINRFTYYDVGQAVAHLSIQATALGLHVHQMGGYDAEKARQVVQLPEGHETMTLIAIGYYGNVEQLNETMRQDELGSRERKPISEFVFGEHWNQPLELAQTENNLVS
jgi:nitroreductase